MPVLDNQRHEAFAQALASGKSADEAYAEAGLMANAFAQPAGFYVYLLIDPRNGRVFYVGKGKGRRALFHWSSFHLGKAKGKKHATLARIHREGLKPRVDVVCDGLSESEAYRIEGAIIRIVGFKRLVNVLPAYVSPQEHARRFLHSIKPFAQWFTEKPRSPDDVALYHFVASGFARVAALP